MWPIRYPFVGAMTRIEFVNHKGGTKCVDRNLMPDYYCGQSRT